MVKDTKTSGGAVGSLRIDLKMELRNLKWSVNVAKQPLLEQGKLLTRVGTFTLEKFLYSVRISIWFCWYYLGSEASKGLGRRT